MYLIKSTRNQGTMIEIVEHGKPINKHIRGFGGCISEALTDDIRTQASLKYIICKFVNRDAPSSIAAPVSAPAAVPETPPTAPAEAFFTEADLSSMKKADLLELAEKNKLEVDSSMTKAELVDFIAEMKLPKEA